MRHFDSVCATPAGWLAIGTNRRLEAVNDITSECVETTAFGQYGQSSKGALKCVPASATLAVAAAIIAHSCFPPRRQQAGTFPFAPFTSASSGETRVKLNTVSSKMERSLRNMLIQY